MFRDGFWWGIGLVDLFFSSIKILNFCFIFGLFEILITFLHKLMSKAFPCLTLRFCSSRKVFQQSCSKCLFFCFIILVSPPHFV